MDFLWIFFLELSEWIFWHEFFGRIFWEELMFLSRFCSNARKEEFRSLEVRGKLIALKNPF